MTLRGVNLAGDLQAAVGREVFQSPTGYNMIALVPAQADTSGWIEGSPVSLATHPSEYVPSGFNSPDQGGVSWASSLALNVGAVAPGRIWHGQGARRSATVFGDMARIQGSRRLAIMVAGEPGGNPRIVWKLRGIRNGVPFEETKITQGLTHQKQAGWTSWLNNFNGNLSARPIDSAFYNPNSAKAILVNITAASATGSPVTITTGDAHFIPTGSTVTISNVLVDPAPPGSPILSPTINGTHVITSTGANTFTIPVSNSDPYVASAFDSIDYGNLGYGGSHREAAIWSRLPLKPEFQTHKCYDGLESIQFVEGSGLSADTIAIPLWKSVSFGLRQKIRSVEDILGGTVELTAFHSFLAGLIPNGTFLLLSLVPIAAPINLEAVEYEPGENAISFTRSFTSGVGGEPNPHIYSNGTNEIDQHGELLMGTFDMPWTMHLDIRVRD